MNEKLISLDMEPPCNLRFLVCDTTSNVGKLSSSEEQWVPSPIRCLDMAVDGNPGLIVISFGEIPMKERDTLVELSTALKRNRHTRHCPILALLHAKHRKLLEDLQQAKVDFVRFIEGDKLDSSRLRTITSGLGREDRLERHLDLICPFLHYSRMDSQHEMKLCGAYLDRMVLGGHRLREICESEDHLHCEYYLSPRLES